MVAVEFNSFEDFGVFVLKMVLELKGLLPKVGKIWRLQSLCLIILTFPSRKVLNFLSSRISKGLRMPLHRGNQRGEKDMV